MPVLVLYWWGCCSVGGSAGSGDGSVMDAVFWAEVNAPRLMPMKTMACAPCGQLLHDGDVLRQRAIARAHVPGERRRSALGDDLVAPVGVADGRLPGGRPSEQDDDRLGRRDLLHVAEGLEDPAPVAAGALRARARRGRVAGARRAAALRAAADGARRGGAGRPAGRLRRARGGEHGHEDQRDDECDGDAGTTVAMIHWPLPEVPLDSSMEDAPATRAGARPARRM